MALQITYADRKIEKMCTDLEAAERKHGTQIAEMIHQRIQEISAADSVEQLVQYHIGKCHPLTGNRSGQYAMSLTKNWRLVFEKVKGYLKVVCIIEVKDYH